MKNRHLQTSLPLEDDREPIPTLPKEVLEEIKDIIADLLLTLAVGDDLKKEVHNENT